MRPQVDFHSPNGFFFEDSNMPRPRPTVQTVELTAKRYKARQAIGLTFLFLGAGIFVVAAISNQEILRNVGALLFVGGITLWIIGRIQAWWNHG